MDGLAGIVDGLAGSVSAGLQLHTFVALEGCDGRTCWVLDFLPEYPASPATALALFSGGSVAGQTRRSVLRAWPRGRTLTTLRVADLPPRFAGPLGREALTRAVDGFEQSWDPALRLFTHDCRDYCQGLIAALTDRRDVSVSALLAEMHAGR
ncbi:hypothetical protein FOA52_012393 [Chlamydomonas sp. UWO 241]|nr:hypothetical protein FOA52_012393 [Chlamydomonas sp. UWO 241]